MQTPAPRKMKMVFGHFVHAHKMDKMLPETGSFWSTIGSNHIESIGAASGRETAWKNENDVNNLLFFPHQCTWHTTFAIPTPPSLLALVVR
jgi:hypothetical protein